jgi:hypothetical protein
VRWDWKKAVPMASWPLARLFDTSSQAQLLNPRHAHCLSFAPDGGTVAIALGDGTIEVRLAETGEPIAAVAEVVNTFREMKLFALQDISEEGLWHLRIAKNFYVSPFSDPGMMFDFKLGKPGATWRVNIDDYENDERTLLSAIRGEQRELTSARLFWYAFKYPLLSLRIIGLIHWHALLLWLKRVPFFQKNERREVQLDVMRPHESLKNHTP